MPSSFLIIVFLFIALMQMTTDQYLPSLPYIATYFKASPILAQSTFSYFMLGMGLSHFIFGPISDKYGRRIPLLCGIGISIVGSLICASSQTITALILGRLLQGVGIGCCNSVGRSLIRDVYEAEKMAKIGSLVGMISILIMITSPVLGGFVFEYYGWQANFWVLAGFGLFVWLLAFVFLPETNQYTNSNATHFSYLVKNTASLLKNRVYEDLSGFCILAPN